MGEYMKIKIMLVSVLLAGSLLVNAGCTLQAVAEHQGADSTQSTAKAAKEKQLCTLQIKSLDKQNITDSVQYKITRLDSDMKETKVIQKALETTNGIVQTELEKGIYRVQAINGDFQQIITISNQKKMNINAECNEMYKILKSTERICFIGDSITIGSASGGYGWYDGLLAKFPNIESVDVAATGGQTSASVFDNEKDMEIINESQADTYVVALGINDVIYRDKTDRATSFTSSEYIQNLENLVSTISAKDTYKAPKFVFVAPFEYINRYSHVMTKYLRRDNTHEEYTIALYNWCKMNGYAFTAPMNYIKNSLADIDNAKDYTCDDIHPSYPLGTQLYSNAVYESSVLNTTGTLNIVQHFYDEKARKKTDSSYADYPTDYIEATVDANVLKATCFSIKDFNTGKYLALELDEKTGQYTYVKTESYKSCYYPRQADGRLTINNIPAGGYIVSCEYNSQGYSAYLKTENIFVNGGSKASNANIHFKNEAEQPTELETKTE